VARVGLQSLGLDPNLVRHGIKREVYAMPMTESFRDVLKGNTRRTLAKRPSTRELSFAALERWVLPRAEARPEFRNLRKSDYLAEHLRLLAERELPL